MKIIKGKPSLVASRICPYHSRAKTQQKDRPNPQIELSTIQVKKRRKRSRKSSQIDQTWQLKQTRQVATQTPVFISKMIQELNQSKCLNIPKMPTRYRYNFIDYQSKAVNQTKLKIIKSTDEEESWRNRSKEKVKKRIEQIYRQQQQKVQNLVFMWNRILARQKLLRELKKQKFEYLSKLVNSD